MSSERNLRRVLRLLPAVLAVWEMRFLLSAAVRLLAGGGHRIGSGHFTGGGHRIGNGHFTGGGHLIRSGHLFSGVDLPGGAHLTAAPLASVTTWLVVMLAVGAVLLLRETGRGVLAAIAAGQLLIGHTGLPHEQLLAAFTPDPGNVGLISATVLLAASGALALPRLITRLAPAHPPPPTLWPRRTAAHPPDRPASPRAAPLLAALSGRGPPVGVLL